MDLEKKFRRANIPERFLGLTFEDFDRQASDPEVEEYLSNAWAVVKDWAENPKQYLPGGPRETLGRGLLLTGDPGTGKTMLAAIALQEVIRQGHKGYFVTLPGYLNLILDQTKISNLFDRGEGTQEAYEEWLNKRQLVLDLRNKVPFLALDDVGKEHLTGSKFAQDEFDFLLRRRFDCAFPTIITTNEAPRRWVETYGKSMESFAREAFTGLAFPSEVVRDRRQWK